MRPMLPLAVALLAAPLLAPLAPASGAPLRPSAAAAAPGGDAPLMVLRVNQPYSAQQTGGTDAPVSAAETPHPGFGRAAPADPAHVQEDRGATDAPLSSARDLPETHRGDQRGNPARAQAQRGSTDGPVDARSVPTSSGSAGLTR